MCVCILASVTQHANRIFSALYYTVICDLSGSTVFFHIISERKLLNINCVVIFSTILSETFLILRRIPGDILIHVRLHVKYLSFLSDVNET